MYSDKLASFGKELSAYEHQGVHSYNPFGAEVAACELQQVGVNTLAPFGKGVAASEFQEMDSVSPCGKEATAREFQEMYFGGELAARELQEINSGNPLGKEVATRERQEFSSRLRSAGGFRGSRGRGLGVAESPAVLPATAGA